jgi:hypothetical protein
VAPNDVGVSGGVSSKIGSRGEPGESTVMVVRRWSDRFQIGLLPLPDLAQPSRMVKSNHLPSSMAPQITKYGLFCFPLFQTFFLPLKFPMAPIRTRTSRNCNQCPGSPLRIQCIHTKTGQKYLSRVCDYFPIQLYLTEVSKMAASNVNTVQSSPDSGPGYNIDTANHSALAPASTHPEALSSSLTEAEHYVSIHTLSTSTYLMHVPDSCYRS